MMVQKWLDKGYSAYEIGLTWNTGGIHEIKGINKYGQEYDSPRYARTVVAYLNSQ